MAEKEKVIRKFRVTYNFMGAEVYICLCGNVPELGSWNPFDGVIAVKKTNTNDFTATIKIERGTALEFKWVTLDNNKRPLRWEAFQNKHIVVNEPEDVVVYDVQWDVIPKIAERKPKPLPPMYAYTASLVEPTAVADQCLHISSTVKSADKKHVVLEDGASAFQQSPPKSLNISGTVKSPDKKHVVVQDGASPTPPATPPKSLNISGTVKSPDKKHVVVQDGASPTQPSTPPKSLNISGTVKSPDKKHVVLEDGAIPTQPSTPPMRQLPVGTPRTLPNTPPFCEEKPAKKFPKYLKSAAVIGAAGVAAGVVYYVGKRGLA